MKLPPSVVNSPLPADSSSSDPAAAPAASLSSAKARKRLLARLMLGAKADKGQQSAAPEVTPAAPSTAKSANSDKKKGALLSARVKAALVRAANKVGRADNNNNKKKKNDKAPTQQQPAKRERKSPAAVVKAAMAKAACLRAAANGKKKTAAAAAAAGDAPAVPQPAQPEQQHQAASGDAAPSPAKHRSSDDGSGSGDKVKTAARQAGAAIAKLWDEATCKVAFKLARLSLGSSAKATAATGGDEAAADTLAAVSVAPAAANSGSGGGCEVALLKQQQHQGACKAHTAAAAEGKARLGARLAGAVRAGLCLGGGSAVSV